MACSTHHCRSWRSWTGRSHWVRHSSPAPIGSEPPLASRAATWRNDTTQLLGGGLGLDVLAGSSRGGGAEADGDGRPPTTHALDVDGALVPTDNSVTDREAKADAFAQRSSREEGLENT